MADMQSKWALNMDKLAYAVAGALALIVLLLPFLFGRDDKSGLLAVAVEDLTKVVDAQKLPGLQPPELAGTIKAHWTCGSALEENPSWTTERPPVFIKLLEKAASFDCKHEPSSIVEIRCERDEKEKRVYLLVKGKLSEANEYVVAKKVEILRKDGVGEGAVIGTAEVSTDFEYKDATVEPGKAYSYAVRTTVVKDPKLADNFKFVCEPVKTSEYLGPTKEVPYEFSLLFSNLYETKFFAKHQYFDYKEKKVVTVPLKEFKEREKFADGRFEIFSVDQAGGKVTVRIAGLTTKDVIPVSKEHRAVEAWEAMVAGGGASPPEEAPPPEKPAPKAGKASKEAKPPAKKSTIPAKKSSAPAKKAAKKK